MILSHSYKPILEWGALGKSLRAGTQHLQQEEGVCTSEANNNMIYLVSKNGSKTSDSLPLGTVEKLN